MYIFALTRFNKIAISSEETQKCLAIVTTKGGIKSESSDFKPLLVILPNQTSNNQKTFLYKDILLFFQIYSSCKKDKQ